MLSMIIADDDVMARETIRDAIDWAAMDIEIIAEAADGREALALCIEKQPDILFTDIMMPHMTGLEVALTLRERGSAAKIIIISGVQDFEYARTAMEMSVTGYVLKPIRIDEVRQVVKKVQNSLHLERDRTQMMARMKRELREQMTLMREKFLCNLVLGLYETREEICDKLEYFDLPLRYDCPLTVAVMRLDDYAALTAPMTEQNRQLLAFAVQNIAQETLDNHDAGLIVNLRENEFVLLIGTPGRESAAVVELLEELAANLQGFLSASVSIGVGHQAAQLAELKYAYDNACMAVQHRFYRGKGTIIAAQEILRDRAFEKIAHASAFSSLYALQERLAVQLKSGETEQCHRALAQIFELLRVSQSFSIAYVRCLCLEFAGTVNRLLYEQGEEDASPLNVSDMLTRLGHAEHLEEVQRLMGEMVEAYCSRYNALYSRRHSELVHRIREMIEMRYMEQLTLGTIADAVYMTQNYICLVFKRETGQTINGYLTRVRMETACRLLTDTKLKVWEIAERVGYENAHYFSTVFKKTYGMQPQQYRGRE